MSSVHSGFLADHDAHSKMCISPYAVAALSFIFLNLLPIFQYQDVP